MRRLILILAVVAFVAFVMVLGTGLTMILFGAVHSFLPVVPAFSFWQTFLVSALFSALTAGFRSATK